MALALLRATREFREPLRDYRNSIAHSRQLRVAPSIGELQGVILATACTAREQRVVLLREPTRHGVVFP
jgi:hypothetical protein